MTKTQEMPNSKPASFEDALTLRTLAQILGLSAFERSVVGLCVSAALDPQTTSKLLELHGKPYPTFALAMRMLEGAHGDALSPERALRYWKLVEVIHPAETPYTAGALRLDERILHYLQGYNHLDERLQAYLLLLPPVSSVGELPATQATAVTKMVALIRGNATMPIVQIVGIDAESKRAVVEQVVLKLGVTLYHLPTDLIPKASHELDLFARLWARESALSKVALYLDAHELDMEMQGEQVKLVQRFLARSGGLFFLSTHDAWNEIGVLTRTFDVAKPTTAEQEGLWQSHVNDNGIATRLAAQFNLSAPAIARVADGLETCDVTLEQAWEACLVQTRPRLDLLAQRITPKATWDDIVLPEWQMTQLKAIAAQVENRGIVYDQWGWRERMSRGLGLTVLFGGDSGTGKTFAAEILANHLNLNLYRIDLSQVVSKYIGETEKNLRKLFDSAENGGTILFFDEADALFGKRSETRSSNDRYANMETNYLLQRLEQYSGLAILTTNLLNNIDDAFMRRVRFIVKFPVPTDEHRALIWQRVFPATTPLAEIDFTYLSRFKLTGGSIYNAALNASFQAARSQHCVEMPHILAAVRMEIDKGGRLPKPHLFEWPQKR